MWVMENEHFQQKDCGKVMALGDPSVAMRSLTVVKGIMEIKQQGVFGRQIMEIFAKLRRLDLIL